MECLPRALVPMMLRSTAGKTLRHLVEAYSLKGKYQTFSMQFIFIVILLSLNMASWHTVEPLYKGHPWCEIKVVTVQGFPL